MDSSPTPDPGVYDSGTADAFFDRFDSSSHVPQYYPALESAPFWAFPGAGNAKRDEAINRRLKKVESYISRKLTAAEREGIAYYESAGWKTWSTIDSLFRIGSLALAVFGAKNKITVQQILINPRSTGPYMKDLFIRSAFLYPLGAINGYAIGLMWAERRVAKLSEADERIRPIISAELEYTKRKIELEQKFEREIFEKEKNLPSNERSSWAERHVRAIQQAEETLRGQGSEGAPVPMVGSNPVLESRSAWARERQRRAAMERQGPLSTEDTAGEAQGSALADIIGIDQQNQSALQEDSTTSESTRKYQGSAWDRLRRDAAQKEHPPRYPRPAASTQTQPSEAGTFWKEDAQHASFDDTTQNESTLERAKAQREFEEMLERERRRSGGETGSWRG